MCLLSLVLSCDTKERSVSIRWRHPTHCEREMEDQDEDQMTRRRLCSERIEETTSCRRIENEEKDGENETKRKCVRLVKRWRQCGRSQPEMLEEKKEEFYDTDGADSTSSSSFMVTGSTGGIFGPLGEANANMGDEERLLREMQRIFTHGALSRDMTRTSSSVLGIGNPSPARSTSGGANPNPAVQLVHEDHGGIFSRLLGLLLTPSGWHIERRPPSSMSKEESE